jgi:putative transposon-encoded protein
MTKNTLPSTINTKIYDLETKTVTSAGNSGAVYLPKSWIGKKVQVLLIEPVNQKGD